MKRFPLAYVLSVCLPLVIIAALLTSQERTARDVQNLVFDGFQRLKPRIYEPEAPVRILDIDDESLERQGQWPWPRTVLADMVSRLKDAGAVAVGFDMGFPEADRNSAEQLLAVLPEGPLRDRIGEELRANEANDARFARALQGAGVVLGAILIERPTGKTFPVVFGLSETGDPALPFLHAYEGAVVPLPDLSAAAGGVGALNWVPDRDQIIRTVPLFFNVGGQIVPSLVAEALRVGQGDVGYILRSSNASGQTSFGVASGVNAVRIGQAQVRTGPAADMRPRFSHTDPRRFIPAWKLLAGEVSREDIEGKIFFVGTSAAGLRDQRATPLDASVPGVEIHAQLTENILAEKILIRPDWAPGLEFLACMVLGIAIAVLLPITTPLWSAMAGGLAMLALGVASFYAFDTYSLLTDPVIPSISIALVYLAGVLQLWREEKAQRRYVRSAFGKYVSPAVVEQLVNDPEKLSIGGETRVLTVMFVDLRSFTTISEGMDAPSITRFMNEYLTPLTDIIIEENGTVDKYMGDAIMAFWNAPLDDANHAPNAVRAALRMRQALADLNVMWQKRDAAEGLRPKLVKFGIGLNTGACSVGNMGSLRRFDYSAMGDSVNLASRLEGASKQYGLDILVSESTRLAAPDFGWFEVDRLRVKGKVHPTTVFGLAGDKDFAQTMEVQTWLARHQQFLDAFRQRDFERASGMIEELTKLAPLSMAALYSGFSKEVAKRLLQPPPEDWDGTRSLDEK